MIKLLKTFSLVAIVALVFTSCSKDDDPTDNDLFIGTYDGWIHYDDNSDGTIIETGDGEVTVTKVGDSYSFTFSNNIPQIRDIEFEEGEDHHINIGNSEVSYIKITAHALEIYYSEDGETWQADCTR